MISLKSEAVDKEELRKKELIEIKERLKKEYESREEVTKEKDLEIE